MNRTTTRDVTVKRLVFLVLGVAWLAMAWRAPWSSVGGFTDATKMVAVSWGWTAWVAVAAGVMVPSPASLTVARNLAPLAVICSVADADPLAAAAATVAATDAVVKNGKIAWTPFDPMRVSTETKSSYKTTELIAYVVAVIGVLIASAVTDTSDFGTQEAWFYITLLTIGYMVSRGLAKSGSREHFGSNVNDAFDTNR